MGVGGRGAAAGWPLDGKVLIDTTNQFGRDESGNFGVLDLPDGLSAAAFNACRAEGARLVKAYNTMTSGFQAGFANRPHCASCKRRLQAAWPFYSG